MSPVPTISVFCGIVVAMFFDEHPPPHFHARHAESKARVEIATGEIIDGELPRRAARLVREWTHRDELEENWRRARGKRPLERVAPLL